MSTRLRFLLASAIIGGAAAQAACAPVQMLSGRIVFERKCAPCHGKGPGHDGAAMLPGTAALQAKYKGEIPAALEDRRDLTYEVLSFVVRNGSGPMPMFRKSELGDQDVRKLADYLRSAAGPKRSRTPPRSDNPYHL